MFGLNQPKQWLHLEWNNEKNFPVLLALWYLQKWSNFLCVFLTIWLEIFPLVLKQLLRSPYVCTVYLVDLLGCLTKYQQSSIDIVQKLPLEDIISKVGFQKELSIVCLMVQFFFPLVYNYTSQEGLIYLLLNISLVNSMESQIPKKLDPENDPQVWLTRMSNENDPREWTTSLTHKNNPREWSTRMTHELEPRVWPTGVTHEFDPREWPTSLTYENDARDPSESRELAHSYCYLWIYLTPFLESLLLTLNR